MKVEVSEKFFRVGIAVLLAHLFCHRMFFWSDRPSDVVLDGDI